MKAFAVILALTLVVFGVLHLRIKPASRKGKLRNADIKDSSYWAMLFVFALVVSAMAAELIVTNPGVNATPWMWAGRITVVLAAVWTIWTRKVLGGNYSPTARNLDPGQTLIKSGPYRLMKHPMYLGNVLTVAGLFMAFDLTYSWLAMPLFLAAILWRVALENRFLQQKFN